MGPSPRMTRKSDVKQAHLLERSLDRADIDEQSGELRCGLSDGSALVVRPADVGGEDDPPNWELISPTGILLEFGPGVRWQISAADATVSSRR